MSTENPGNYLFVCRLDESHRPVKLRKVVLSYPCSERQSEFRFDLSLNYKLSGVIQTYSDQKPTLVVSRVLRASFLGPCFFILLNYDWEKTLQCHVGLGEGYDFITMLLIWYSDDVRG